VSDESQLQVTRKDEYSLALSSERSSLVARGRRDAARLVVRCNKCGEPKELVFASCVCAGCSDALDDQWASYTATDWVLIAKRPPEKDGERPWYAMGIVGRLRVIKQIEVLELERDRGATEIPPGETAEVATPVVPPSGRQKLWPPLEWLDGPSPDAEVDLLYSGEELCRYVFRNTTYTQIKLHWAKSDSTGSLVIGEALADDRYRIDVQTVAAYLKRIGVSSKQLEEASEEQLAKWSDSATEGHTDTAFIRPANPEEIDTHNGLLRDQKRREQSTRILEKWGFDAHGKPFSGSMDDDDANRRGLQAWDEIKRTFDSSGLLKGSMFEYEEELRERFF